MFFKQMMLLFQDVTDKQTERLSDDASKVNCIALYCTLEFVLSCSFSWGRFQGLPCLHFGILQTIIESLIEHFISSSLLSTCTQSFEFLQFHFFKVTEVTSTAGKNAETANTNLRRYEHDVVLGCDVKTAIVTLNSGA